MTTHDVRFEDFGSIWLVTPMTATARSWIEENVATESWQWIGGSLAVEPRCVPNLAEGMQAAGLNASLN